MIDRTPEELRRLADCFRAMSATGDDEGLKAALRELADEFDLEADLIDRRPPAPTG